jgi:hypothetical protein
MVYDTVHRFGIRDTAKRAELESRSCHRPANQDGEATLAGVLC